MKQITDSTFILHLSPFVYILPRRRLTPSIFCAFVPRLPALVPLTTCFPFILKQVPLSSFTFRLSPFAFRLHLTPTLYSCTSHVRVSLTLYPYTVHLRFASHALRSTLYSYTLRSRSTLFTHTLHLRSTFHTPRLASCTYALRFFRIHTRIHTEFVRSRIHAEFLQNSYQNSYQNSFGPEIIRDSYRIRTRIHTRVHTRIRDQNSYQNSFGPELIPEFMRNSYRVHTRVRSASFPRLPALVTLTTYCPFTRCEQQRIQPPVPRGAPGFPGGCMNLYAGSHQSPLIATSRPNAWRGPSSINLVAFS